MKAIPIAAVAFAAFALAGCDKAKIAQSDSNETKAVALPPLNKADTDKDAVFKDAKPFDPSSYTGGMNIVSSVGDQPASLSLYVKEGTEFKPFGEMEIKGNMLLGAEGLLAYPGTFLRLKLAKSGSEWRELERRAIKDGRLFVETKGDRETFTIYGINAGQFTAIVEPGIHPQESKTNESTASAPPPLKVRVTSVAVATKFQAYVGGGSNISPPEPPQSPFGGGGGMPMISIGGGSTFVAGEVRSQNEGTKLIQLKCTIENSTANVESFKIGDLSLSVAGERAGDFMAVGYGDTLCAMSDDDRRSVKQTVVEVSPNGHRTLSYIFPWITAGAKQGEILLRNSPPVPFQIDTSPAAVPADEIVNSPLVTPQIGK